MAQFAWYHPILCFFYHILSFDSFFLSNISHVSFVSPSISPEQYFFFKWVETNFAIGLFIYFNLELIWFSADTFGYLNNTCWYITILKWFVNISISPKEICKIKVYYIIIYIYIYIYIYIILFFNDIMMFLPSCCCWSHNLFSWQIYSNH